MEDELPDMNLRTSDITDMKISASDEPPGDVIPSLFSRKGGTKQEDQLVKFALPGFLSELDERVYDLEQKPQPKQSGYGVSVAMLLWSLAFLLFPKFVMLPLWLGYCFDVLGLVALLIGILGTGIEVFKGKA